MQMRKRWLIRTVAAWLPMALLAVVLHVHAGPAAPGPVLNSAEEACPVCAATRGGMQAPPAPVQLPADPGVPEIVQVPFCNSPARASLPAHEARGPPSSL